MEGKIPHSKVVKIIKELASLGPNTEFQTKVINCKIISTIENLRAGRDQTCAGNFERLIGSNQEIEDCSTCRIAFEEKHKGKHPPTIWYS